MKTAIIGGGLMGMALAWKLAQRGISVDVYESDTQLGGLATHHNFESFVWDRFYHVILPSDRELIRFIGQIGLSEELNWKRTRTGFFVDNKMHSVSSTVEFLRFPLLNLVDKIRLALTMIYSSRIKNWQRLETISVETWLRKVSGKRTYEKLWLPLLKAKLGDNYREASAVFIWSYIKRLFSARDSSASKEQLGHVSQGYKQVFDALQNSIIKDGGRVVTNTKVNSIRPEGDSLICLELQGSGTTKYKNVICTSPVPVLRKLADSSLLRTLKEGQALDYLGVVCVVLVSREEVSPYYVVNIADSEVPFTGVIGMSSVVDTRFTGGRYLTYLPKYVRSDNEFFEMPDEVIINKFLPHLQKMFPQFDSASIESVVVNRARRVQPLQVLNYSSIVPQVETAHPGFFALNTAQFVNGTLNNNEVIRAVDQFFDHHIGKIQQRVEQS